MFFKYFYETLLLSLIRGWQLKKPMIMLDEATSDEDWKTMKTELKEWIIYYRKIVVSKVHQNFLFDKNGPLRHT
jgi:hypothetical protein